MIIIPEIHDAPELSERLIPLLRNYIKNNSISIPEVLNVSEGYSESDLFKKMYGTKNHKFMNEISEKLLERDPMFNGIIYIQALIDIIKDIEFIRTRVLLGSPIPYDAMYIQTKIFGFKIDKLIPPPRSASDTPDPFYKALNLLCNAAAHATTENEDVYEERFYAMIEALIPYFEQYNGYRDIDFTGTWKALQSMDSIQVRAMIFPEFVKTFREHRDAILFERIAENIPKLKSKLVILVIGLNHMTNFARLVSENDTMEMVEDIHTSLLEGLGTLTAGIAGIRKHKKSRKSRKSRKSKRSKKSRKH